MVRGVPWPARSPPVARPWPVRGLPALVNMCRRREPLIRRSNPNPVCSANITNPSDVEELKKGKEEGKKGREGEKRKWEGEEGGKKGREGEKGEDRREGKEDRKGGERVERR